MICAYKSCDNEFEPKTHNQKYCCDECCRIATNEKIKQKYYEKKERLAGKRRICKNKGCNVSLSRYNPEYICGPCQAREKKKMQTNLINMVKDVTS